MKNYGFYLFLLLNFACKPKTEIHYFSKYGATNNLIHKNEFILSIDRIQFLQVLSSKNKVEPFIFKEKQQENGIYRQVGSVETEYKQTHPLYLLDTAYLYFKSDLPEYSPILNRSVRYQKERFYVIDKDTFKIAAFSETHQAQFIGFHSYYLFGFGFINYYHNESDSYFLCDSVVNGSISTPKLHQIEQRLLSDSTFFARHIYNNLNYYRAKGNE